MKMIDVEEVTTEIDSIRQRPASHKSSVPSDSIPSIAYTDEITLKRHLNLWSGVCFIVGITIGSGIFVSPKGVLKYTESVGLCLTIWVVSGLVALLGALCFAEIGTVIPRSGAELAYMKEGIGSVHERTGDILAYLFNWTNTLILKPASAAVLTMTFAEYFLSGIMDSCGPPDELVKITSIFTLRIVSAANRLNIMFVICKVVTILTVIVVGIVRIAQGHTEYLQNGFDGTTIKPLSIALAFYAGLWAYDGWNCLNSITEELKNPQRNLWLSIVLALPSVIILYLLTNISYFTVMNKAVLLSSNAVAVTWGEFVLGRIAGHALPILISISALGSANGSLFSSARYCMVGAQYGYLPEIFSYIQKTRLTPLPSIVLQGVISIIFCIPSNIDGLIDIFSFSAWIFYGLTFVATLCCKFTMKKAKRVISVPIPLIILIILISIYLVIAPVIVNPCMEFLIASFLILFGMVFYYPFVYYRVELECIKKMTKFFEDFFDMKIAIITMSLNSSRTDIDSIHRRQSNSSIIQKRHLTNEIFNKQDSLNNVLSTDDIALKRHLGLFSGVCFIVGMIIGSGIFVSPKGVLRGTQSIGLCLIIWIASGLVSLLGALCYAEIGAVIPRNGAEIAYMKEGIGSIHERIGEILAYLFNWTSTLILKPASIAVLTLTFSQYFLSGIFIDCDPPEELVKITAVFAILTTIVTVIIVGIVRMAQGYTQNLQNGFEGTTTKPLSVALAFYSGLWAYDGWNGLNSITEELKNPERNLWLSIVLALPSIIILYLLTNISYFTVMSKVELLSSNAVAVTWGEVAIGPVVRALPILISISALGSGNGALFSSARYCMVGAQYGYLPEIFACIHKQRLTPVPGIVLEGLIAIALCMPSNIEGLIDFFSFAAWIFYGVTFLATLFCKFTMKKAKRVINVPIPLIIIIILIAIYLVFAPVIADPNIGFLIASLIILFGLIFYYPFVYRKIEVNIIKRINQFLITFFQLQIAQVNL
ncbi:unnamed protein product [Rotaria sp. Silwood1]|nr:unnamed protein product [Rotaria sp. Silwood1]